MSDERQKVLEAIFLKQYGRLRQFLRKRLSHEDAEDVLQTTFYRLIKADSLLYSAEWVVAWLFRVAKNEIVNLSRKKKEVTFTDFFNDDEQSFEDVLMLMLEEQSTSEDEQLRAFFWQELESALSELPEEQRFVFERTEFKGQSYKELAEETGTAQNTLISRKYYAVSKLRERLQGLRDEIFYYKG